MANSANIDHLRIATPCPISWEQMTGDSRVRFCDHCRLNVYNISELSRIEAETLIASAEGRLCARLFRRADGTVLTKDCPVGLRALRMRISKRAAAVFTVIAGISAAVFGQQPAAKDGKTACVPQTRITRTAVPPEHPRNVLSGTVMDPNGAVVPGAHVTITNVETKESKTATTNDLGRFEFASLAPGNYSLTIEETGIKTFKLMNVAVEADKLVNLDTIVEISGVATIGIMTDMPIRAVDTTPPGTFIISGDLLRRLPIPK
jgi:hypothetical protein